MPVTTTTVVNTIPKYNCFHILYIQNNRLKLGNYFSSFFLLELFAYVITENVWVVADFNSVSDVAKNSADPQEHGETAKKLVAKLNPFWRGLWWR